MANAAFWMTISFSTGAEYGADLTVRILALGPLRYAALLDGVLILEGVERVAFCIDSTCKLRW